MGKCQSRTRGAIVLRSDSKMVTFPGIRVFANLDKHLAGMTIRAPVTFADCEAVDVPRGRFLPVARPMPGTNRFKLVESATDFPGAAGKE